MKRREGKKKKRERESKIVTIAMICDN